MLSNRTMDFFATVSGVMGNNEVKTQQILDKVKDGDIDSYTYNLIETVCEIANSVGDYNVAVELEEILFY